MPESAPSAPSPAPAAPAAQTSDAKPSAGNLSASQLAQRFLKADAAPAPAEQTTPEAKAPEAPTPAAGAEQTPAPAEAEPKKPEADNNQTAEGNEDEADSDLSQKHSLTPEQQAAFNRRLGKEVAKTKRALERAAAVEARLAEIERQAQAQQPENKPQVVPLPAGAPPLANIETVQDLSALQQQAKEAVRWAEEMLETDGIDNGVQVGNEVYTKAQLREIRRNAKVTLEDHIPARVQFLQQRNQAQQAAYAEFPFLKDKTSENYQMAQAIYRDMPWPRNVPNADWIVGLGVEGYNVVQARKAAAAKPKEPAKIDPPKPPASQTAVSAGSSVRAAVSNKVPSVGEMLKGKGGVSGSQLATLLAQRETARNSR